MMKKKALSLLLALVMLLSLVPAGTFAAGNEPTAVEGTQKTLSAKVYEKKEFSEITESATGLLVAGGYAFNWDTSGSYKAGTKVTDLGNDQIAVSGATEWTLEGSGNSYALRDKTQNDNGYLSHSYAKLTHSFSSNGSAVNWTVTDGVFSHTDNKNEGCILLGTGSSAGKFAVGSSRNTNKAQFAFYTPTETPVSVTVEDATRKYEEGEVLLPIVTWKDGQPAGFSVQYGLKPNSWSTIAWKSKTEAEQTGSGFPVGVSKQDKDYTVYVGLFYGDGKTPLDQVTATVRITDEREASEMVVKAEPITYTYNKGKIDKAKLLEAVFDSYTNEIENDITVTYNNEQIVFGEDGSAKSPFGEAEVAELKFSFAGNETHQPCGMTNSSGGTLNSVTVALVDERTEQIQFTLKDNAEYGYEYISGKKVFNESELFTAIINEDFMPGYEGNDVFAFADFEYYIVGRSGSLTKIDFNGTHYADLGTNASEVKILIKYPGNETIKPSTSNETTVSLFDKRIAEPEGDKYKLNDNASYTLYYTETGTLKLQTGYPDWSEIYRVLTEGSNIPEGIAFDSGNTIIEYQSGVTGLIWTAMGDDDGALDDPFATSKGVAVVIPYSIIEPSEKVRLNFKGDDQYQAFTTESVTLTIVPVPVDDTKTLELETNKDVGFQKADGIPTAEQLFNKCVTSKTPEALTHNDVDITYETALGYRSLSYSLLGRSFGSNSTEKIRFTPRSKVVVEDGKKVLYRPSILKRYESTITFTDSDKEHILFESNPSFDYNEYMRDTYFEDELGLKLIRETVASSNPAIYVVPEGGEETLNGDVDVKVEYFAVPLMGSKLIDEMLLNIDALWQPLYADTSKYAPEIPEFIVGAIKAIFRPHDFGSGGEGSKEWVRVTITDKQPDTKASPKVLAREYTQITLTDNRKDVTLSFESSLESMGKTLGLDDLAKLFKISGEQLDRIGLLSQPVVYTPDSTEFKEGVIGTNGRRVTVTPAPVEEESEGTVLTPEVGLDKFTVSPDTLNVSLLSTQNVTVHYNGDVNYKAADITVKVYVLQADSKLDVPYTQVVYGAEPGVREKIETTPNDLSHAVLISGIDGDAHGFVSLTLSDAAKESMEVRVSDVLEVINSLNVQDLLTNGYVKNLLDSLIGDESEFDLDTLLALIAKNNNFEALIEEIKGTDADIVLVPGYEILAYIVGQSQKIDLTSLVQKYSDAFTQTLRENVSESSLGSGVFSQLVKFNTEALASLIDAAADASALVTNTRLYLDEEPTEAGLYWVGAVSTDLNYQLAMDVSGLVITQKTEDISLKWNDDFKTLKYNGENLVKVEDESQTVSDFEATLKDASLVGEQLLKAKDDTEHVYTEFFRVPGEIQDLEVAANELIDYFKSINLSDITDITKIRENLAKADELKAEWISSEAIKKPGTYVEVAFVLGGNYFAMPIARVYKINYKEVIISDFRLDLEESSAYTGNELVLVDGKHNAYTIEYDGQPHKFTATVKDADNKDISGDLERVSYTYYDMLGNLIPVIDLFHYPTNAGQYKVVVTVLGDEMYADTIKTFTVTILPQQVDMKFANPFNGIMSWTTANGNEEEEIKPFDFGYVIGEGKSAHAVTDEEIKEMKIRSFFGGAVLELVPTVDRDPIRESGIYMQIGYNLNPNYAIDPIYRLYIVADKKVTITGDKASVTFNGRPQGITPVVKAEDGKDISESPLVYIQYVGRDVFGKTYNSMIPPTNAGKYTAIVYYNGVADMFRNSSIGRVGLTINPASIEGVPAPYVITGVENVYYNGKVQPAQFTVRSADGRTVLVEGRDYKVSYKLKNKDGSADPKEAGEYVIVVTGKGNYTGTIYASYVITNPSGNPTMTAHVGGENRSVDAVADAKSNSYVTLRDTLIDNIDEILDRRSGNTIVTIDLTDTQRSVDTVNIPVKALEKVLAALDDRFASLP